MNVPRTEMNLYAFKMLKETAPFIFLDKLFYVL